MNYIERQKIRIQNLELEVARLQHKEVEMKNDVHVIISEFKMIGDETGLTEIMEESLHNEFKMSTIIQLLAKIGMKLTLGKIKMDTLKIRFYKVQPILAKYQYLIETQKTLN